MQDHVDLLAQTAFFDGLSREDLDEIARACALESWPKGYPILGPTSFPDRFRIILSGRVKITRSNGAGREYTLWLLGRGDGFDVVSLLDGQPFPASAVALDEVQTLAMPASLLREWIERFPPLRRLMARCVARRMRELADFSSDVVLHDTTSRLARLLLRHLDSSGKDAIGKPNLIQDLPHEELAALIGSVRVVVTRALSELKAEAAIGVHEGALRIADLKRLLRRAEAKVSRKASKTSAPRTGNGTL